MANGQNTQQIVSLEAVRTSYLYVFKPYQGTDSAGKPTFSYTGHAILEPGSQNVAKVKAAQLAAAIAQWGPGGAEVLQQLAAQDRVCLHSGDRNKPGEEAYKGKLYVSANNSSRPSIVVSRGGVNVVIDETDPCAPYSGCIANYLFGIWAQQNKWGRRINASFMGIQFVKHAPRLGGSRIASPEEFGVVAPEADGAVPMAAAAAPIAQSAGSDLV